MNLSTTDKHNNSNPAHRSTSLTGLCAGLIVATLGLALPTQAATLDVCASGCSYWSINAAVAAASPGDILELEPETFNQGGIYIGKNLTIRSASGRALIQAGTSSYAFFVDQGVVVKFKNLGMRGGTLSRLDNRGYSILSNVQVLGTGPSNPSLEGGVANRASGQLVIRNNSVIAANASTFAGGGITNYGELTLISSTVMSNFGYQGGGVYNGGGMVSVLFSSFSSNQAADQGGAWANDSGTFAFHSSSSYSGNSAAVSCNKYWNPSASPSCVN